MGLNASPSLSDSPADRDADFGRVLSGINASASPKGNPLTNLRSETIPFDLDRSTRDEIARFLAEAALAAGPAVMEEYGRGGVRSKEDGSPVTVADHRAEAIICAYMARVVPSTPLVAEELTAAGVPICVAERFILVDPLDGTREFISGNGEFTINVALIAGGYPIAGAVYAPAIGRLWIGGDHAYLCAAPVGEELAQLSPQRIKTRAAPSDLIALASRSHRDTATDAFLNRLPVADCRSAGSSLKFCVIAEGAGDVYPRFAPTMEWDTAAGDAVLRAAGGVVVDRTRRPLAYGKFEDRLRNGAFVAWGDAEAAKRFGYC